MDFVTIGEYADPEMFDLVNVQRVDLSSGAAASEPFEKRTRHVRVCATVDHLWAFNGTPNQLRPAMGVEEHKVDHGQSWRMTFKVEE
jgi:hypothetical protein